MADDASRMVKWLFPAFAVLLLVVLALFLSSYLHPMPEQDCSKPYDYPICSRANAPLTATPPSTIALFLGIVLTAVLAALFCYAGYHASVIEQTAIITPTASLGKQPAALPTPPAPDTKTVAPPAATPTTGIDIKTLK